MRVAVLGLGAMGSLVLARLAATRARPAPPGTPELVLLGHSRGGTRAARHRERGVRLESPGGDPAVVVRPEAGRNVFTCAETGGVPGELRGTFDYAVVCGKAAATPALAAVARQVLAPAGAAFCLANGLGHEETLGEALGAGRVLGATTTHGAFAKGDGSVVWAGKGAIELAAVGGRGPSPGLTGLLREAGLNPVVVDRPTHEVRWRKLLLNVSINPLAALRGVENGGLLEPELFQQARGVLLEAKRVAAAAGVRLPDDEALVAALRAALEATASNKCSTLQDVLASRPTERAALTGAVLRQAERLGIQCPRVAWLDAALHTYDGTVAGTYAEQGGEK